MKTKKFEDMLNVVLLPEIFKPINFPLINYPTISVKQTYVHYDNLIDGNVKFYPENFIDELSINNKTLNTTKGTKYMKEAYVYACSIQIYAKFVYHDKKGYKNSFRKIHQPDFSWDEEKKTLWEFNVKGLEKIVITRHIQFINKPEYKELFESSVSLPDPDDIIHYNHYLSIYNYA